MHAHRTCLEVERGEVAECEHEDGRPVKEDRVRDRVEGVGVGHLCHGKAQVKVWRVVQAKVWCVVQVKAWCVLQVKVWVVGRSKYLGVPWGGGMCVQKQASVARPDAALLSVL